MRVGFVLRSAEIKPLVPKICAGIFSYEKILVHLAPPYSTLPLPGGACIMRKQHQSLVLLALLCQALFPPGWHSSARTHRQHPYKSLLAP